MRSVLYFKKLVKEGQINTGGGEFLVSKVYFDLEIGHSMHSGLTAAIKQKIGPGSESAPLEVSEPEGYEGSFNYGGFRNAVTGYYKSVISLPPAEGSENIINKTEETVFYINTRG